MVKSISRRVVVIRSPDKKIFEEAIFIVREESYNEKSVTAEMIVKEAQAVADRYVKENLKKRTMPKFPPLFFTAVGALITGAVWIATILI